MKKILPVIILAVLSASTFNAQEKAAVTRAVMKGQNSVNVYYGLSLGKGVWTALFQDKAGINVGGLGPVGLVYEHMVSDGVGLGAEFSYSSLIISWNEEELDFSTNEMRDYEAAYSVTTMRAMVRANFHFAKSPNFDAYFLLSAGYKHRTTEFSYDGPRYSANWSLPNFIPFGIKPGIGLRYFFAGPIGLHMEIAGGTPVMCGGLSVRF